MDFRLNEEQQMLQDTVERLVRVSTVLKNDWRSVRRNWASAPISGSSLASWA